MSHTKVQVHEGLMSLTLVFLFPDFINMFLMKYENPKSEDIFKCPNMTIEAYNVSTLGCSSQTTFYPHQVLLIHMFKQVGNLLQIEMCMPCSNYWYDDQSLL